MGSGRGTGEGGFGPKTVKFMKQGQTQTKQEYYAIDKFTTIIKLKSTFRSLN